jgi:hypothetical protein
MDYSDLTLITIVSGTLIPILVALVSKLNASPGLKAILNFGFSAIVAAIALENEASFNWRSFTINFALTYLVSIATYYGLFKPTGVTQTVAEKTKDIGIG